MTSDGLQRFTRKNRLVISLVQAPVNKFIIPVHINQVHWMCVCIGVFNALHIIVCKSMLYHLSERAREYPWEIISCPKQQNGELHSIFFNL